MSGSGAPRPSVPGKKSEESVCVAVNIRPLIEIELDQGCQECLYVTPGLGQVRLQRLRCWACCVPPAGAAQPQATPIGVGTGRSGPSINDTHARTTP